MFVLNTCFLHVDVRGRPHCTEDFRQPLSTLGVLNDLVSLKTYLVNQLWIITKKTAEAKRKLLETRHLQVKGRRSYILDTNCYDVRFKFFPVPHYVEDATLRGALVLFSSVEGVPRDFWRLQEFEGFESSTQIALMSLQSGLTLESPPH